MTPHLFGGSSHPSLPWTRFRIRLHPCVQAVPSLSTLRVPPVRRCSCQIRWNLRSPAAQKYLSAQYRSTPSLLPLARAIRRRNLHNHPYRPVRLHRCVQSLTTARMEAKTGRARTTSMISIATRGSRWPRRCRAFRRARCILSHPDPTRHPCPTSARVSSRRAAGASGRSQRGSSRRA